MGSRCSIGKGLALLVFFILKEQIYAQRPIRFPDSNNDEQTCPRGTQCVDISRCSIRIRSTMDKDPRECGYTYNGMKWICCPQREPNPFQRPRSVLQPSRSQQNAPVPMPDVPRLIPEPLAPVADVTGADNRGPIRFAASNSNEQICPRGFRCVVINRCFYRALTKMTEEPKECGTHNNGKRRICCPMWKPNKQRFSRSIHAFQPTGSQRNAPAQLHGISEPAPKTPAPEAPAPAADVLTPRPEKPRPILNNQRGSWNTFDVFELR